MTHPICFKCLKDISSLGNSIGRRDECPHCRAAVHVCKNCRHWDTRAYNECHESQAERVLEKERENFCDFFSLRKTGATTTDGQQDPQAKARADLDKLFS